MSKGATDPGRLILLGFLAGGACHSFSVMVLVRRRKTLHMSLTFRLMQNLLMPAYIAFGGLVAETAAAYIDPSYSKLVMGATFPVCSYCEPARSCERSSCSFVLFSKNTQNKVGLVLVIVCGAELFTGNVLMLLVPACTGKIKWWRLVKVS